MSITSYTLNIKELCNSLGSISINVEDDEMVQICLGGLTPRFGAMRTVVRNENQCYWLKKTMFEPRATPPKVKFSTLIQTEEEDAVEREEADSTKDEVVRPMKITPNFDKKTETTCENSFRI